QRFIQALRRGERPEGWRRKRDGDVWKRAPLKVKNMRVVEPNEAGVVNHANLVLATNGPMPSKHELKAVWAHVTYGTSFELDSNEVKEGGTRQLSNYLAKFLGRYLSKTLDGGVGAGGEDSPAEGGARTSDGNATRLRVSNYVSSSRDWLPEGAQDEWVSTFVENAYFWRCDRGFYHTEMGQTMPKWLN